MPRPRRAPPRRLLQEPSQEPLEVHLDSSGFPLPEDFEELVDRYQALVFQYVHQMVRDHHLTEDLSQEIFLKVYRKFSSYDPSYLLSTWILRVSHNHVVDHLRRRRVPTVSMQQPTGEGEGTLADSLPQRRPEPGELVERRDGRRRLREAIYAMPLEQRSVLVLRFLEGRKLEEIAYISNLALGTVKSRLARARSELRERLDRSRRREEHGR
jgi:RNA polymerase sigma-70 factor (ECF subfamily)